MKHLSDSFFTADYNFYVLLLFTGIGFLAGFFIKLNLQKGRGKFDKLEKEAELNQARIASLKEKIEILEKENNGLNRPAADQQSS